MMNARRCHCLRVLATALAAACVAASASFAETVEVASVAELTAELVEQTAGKEIVLKASGSPYLISATLSITNAITLRGETGDPADVVINAQKKCTAIYVAPTAGNAWFIALTVKGGRSVNGGGTTANNRGGGFTLYSAAVVSNCIITACYENANGSGVGLRIDNSGAILTHSKVIGNGDAGGGQGSGVYLAHGSVRDCLIANNGTTTYGTGGGMRVTGGTVVNCTIADNKAKTGGGLSYTSGSFYNTVIYGNTAGSSPELHGSNQSSYAGAKSIASSVAFGSDGIVLTASPFTSTYELDPATGAACINAGDNSLVVSSKDLFGNARIFTGDGVGTVDIGCHEYSKIEVVPGLSASPMEGAGPTPVELTATVVPDTLAPDCTYCWYLDGSETCYSHARVCTNTFAVGRHSVKLVVTYGGTDYPVEKPLGYITIYPTDAYLDPKGTDPVWPYDTPEHAATNVAVAVSEVLKSGVTLHVSAGLYPLTNTVSIGAGQRFVGAGRERTIFYNSNPKTGKFRNFYLNGAGAYVSGVCSSNAYSNTSQHGSGVCIDTAGGTFEDGLVIDCKGGLNTGGGGVSLVGSSCVMRRTIIVNNQTEKYAGDPESLFIGGGAVLGDGSLLEDCLVISNRAMAAGGVRATGANIRNCTIVGNTSGATNYSGNCVGGGGLATGTTSTQSWTFDNCIIYGNRDCAVPESEKNLNHDFVGETGRLRSCCLPVSAGTACVTDDPRFVDAANGDYRILSGSPCRYAGTYQDWMATATDFYGNPRAIRRHVDIGCHQTQRSGLAVFVP